MPQPSFDAPAVLVALGANLPTDLGPPEVTVRQAATLLAERFPGATCSRLFRNPAFPAGSGPDFVNAAVAFRSDLPPHDLMEVLHEIESALGRVRGQRWSARRIDLDLLAVGDVVLPDPQTHAEWRSLPIAEQMKRAPEGLILPHPRLQDRAFVLCPLADVAPDWHHPVLKLSVTQMRDALPAEDRADVIPL